MSEIPIVTTTWLAENLDDPAVRIIDIRGHVLPASEPPPHYHAHRAEYDDAHIPGAVFVDWTSEIIEEGSPSYDIAPVEKFTKLMNSLGIEDGIHVVAYDDANGMFAARFWWALNYYGHDRVSVLDGGWNKWLEEGRSVTSDVPMVQQGDFHARPNTALRVTADDILEIPAGTTLIDVRSLAEYVGEASRASRKGHIPGAIHLPWKSLVSEQGAMKDRPELDSIFKEAGIESESQPIIVYCNSGVSASYEMLALRTAGFQNVSLYDGSWKDWGNDPSKPIE